MPAMVRLLFVIYSIGPALIAYSFADLLKNHEITEQVKYTLPASLLITMLMFGIGDRWLKRSIHESILNEKFFRHIKIGVVVFAFLLFGMLYFVLME